MATSGQSSPGSCTDWESDIPDLEEEERIEELEALQKERQFKYFICTVCHEGYKIFKSARKFLRHQERDHTLKTVQLVTEKDLDLNPDLVMRKITPLEDMSPLFSSEESGQESEEEVVTLHIILAAV